MISRLAIAFALLISGISFRSGFAQSACPVIAQNSLAVSGQTLPLILVGNVQIDAHPVVTRTISPAGRGSVNVRALPSAEAALVGSIPAGGTLITDGRLSDGTWLHVQLADGGSGWVSSSVVIADGGLTALATRSIDDTASPGNAGFDLNASADPNCPDAPNGVLLRTPDGISSLILNVDGLILDLNKATVFISDDEQGLGIAVLDGEVLVQSGSNVMPIDAGMETHIARSADGRASGQPSAPVASDPAAIGQLPMTLLSSVSTTELTPAPAETQNANVAATLADSYQFAIDSSAAPTCISAELSPDEVDQEGKAIIQNIPPWTTAVRYLQANESIDVPVAGGDTNTIRAVADDQVITLTVVDYGRETLAAMTQVAPGRYEFLQTTNGDMLGYRVETTSLPILKLTLIFTYKVTVTIGGDSGMSSSRSCQNFEVYLTGTPQS